MNRSANHSLLRAAIQKRLKDAGAWVYAVAGNPFGRKGVPDLLCCLQGRLIAVEVKTGRGEVTPEQAREIERLREAGALALVARSVEDVNAALAEAGFAAPTLFTQESPTA